MLTILVAEVHRAQIQYITVHRVPLNRYKI